MSQKQIKMDIRAAIEAARLTFTTFPLEVQYGNLAVMDPQSQAPYLCVKIDMQGSKQVDFSNKPMKRWFGDIKLSASVMKGSGDTVADAILDHFVPLLEKTSLGSVRTYMGDAAGSAPNLGREYFSTLIPFWSDQIT